MVDTLRAHACDVETALKQKHAHIFERAILMHDVAFAFHFGKWWWFWLTDLGLTYWSS